MIGSCSRYSCQPCSRPKALGPVTKIFLPQPEARKTSSLLVNVICYKLLTDGNPSQLAGFLSIKRSKFSRESDLFL